MRAKTNAEKIECLENFTGKKRLEKEDPLTQIVELSTHVLEQPHLPLEPLRGVEVFYREIGGIVGYHVTCLQLLHQKETRGKKGRYHAPKPIDLTERHEQSPRWVEVAVENLGKLAALFPIGGAADRLSLVDATSSRLLPAARLTFCGSTLLERLVEDLQAIEYLHFKCFQKQVQIPILLMTSDEKRGDAIVREILAKRGWFGRGEESFSILVQPLAPTMDGDGTWCLEEGTLSLKPGGHGVIWKLARETGALDAFEERGIEKLFLRQINNPIAGVDDGLLMFLGIGWEREQSFGFAACPRMPGASEGVDVVIETEEGNCLTNIEYCDFAHFEVSEEQPLLANTNLLFADLKVARELSVENPFPGMLVNAKKGGSIRLESTMQNLADALIEKKKPDQLEKSFITTNLRRKTISSIKRGYSRGQSPMQTAELCLYNLLENSRELLETFLHFDVPKLPDLDTFLELGPPFLFHYHPALGPLYPIIAKKIQRGTLVRGSELSLQIADLQMEDLYLDGAFKVATDAPMGHFDEKGRLIYSNETGKCILRNITVRNLGIHRDATRCYWSGDLVYKERLEIFIEEGGEFYADGVTFEGDIRIRVPSGVKVSATMEGGILSFHEEVLQKPSWSWRYSFDSQHNLSIKKE